MQAAAFDKVASRRALVALVGVRRVCIVLCHDGLDMLHIQALPRHIGADECRVDVDYFALGDLGADAGLHRAGEDLAKQLSAPSLPDARERRMVGQRFMEEKSREPPDCDVHLRLSHQPAVVNDA
jgi:hypothetical protein